MNNRTKLINEIAKIAEEHNYTVVSSPYNVQLRNNNESFYGAEVYCDISLNTNELLHFSVSFSGYGVLPEEKETEYFNELVNARNMCNKLNALLLKHEQ